MHIAVSLRKRVQKVQPDIIEGRGYGLYTPYHYDRSNTK